MAAPDNQAGDGPTLSATLDPESLALARTARDGFCENGKASEVDLRKLEVWLAARE